VAVQFAQNIAHFDKPGQAVLAGRLHLPAIFPQFRGHPAQTEKGIEFLFTFKIAFRAIGKLGVVLGG